MSLTKVSYSMINGAVYNVLDYGAVGNGVADDTSAIVATIAACKTSGFGGQVYFPTPEYCTDNGAMVAYAGCMHLLQGEQDADLSIQTRARWPLFDRMMQISLDDKK